MSPAQKRVQEIVSAWLDGQAGPESLRELNDLLRGDPDACETYLNLISQDAQLRHEFLGIVPGLPEFPGLKRRVFRFPKAAAAAWMGLAAALAISLMGNAALFFNQPEESPVPRPPVENGVAVLSRVVEPDFGAGRIFAEGDAIAPGLFELRSGLAQLEFFDGATLIVEGPARLDLAANDRVVLHRGRVRAFVPEPAQGFTIVAPDVQAVDLGTEFALSVGEDGRSEIHVVDGEVRLDDRAGQVLRHLNTGDGARNAAGWESIPSQGNAFVGREEILKLADARWKERYEVWRRHRDQILRDPAALVYFDFDNHAPWDRQLVDRVPAGPNGAIVGAPWTQGRWPGKGALEFKRITDRVRLEVPGEFQALTLAAWVRVEGFDRWLSSLMLTDGWDPGEVHWQISDAGELILGANGYANAFSPPVIGPDDLGRWLHLAVTIDSSGKLIRHYLDGELVGEVKMTAGGPLRIGAAEIGNWTAQGKPEGIRSLNGRMDEFAVLKRALSAGEIREIYRAGTPN